MGRTAWTNLQLSLAGRDENATFTAVLDGLRQVLGAGGAFSEVETGGDRRIVVLSDGGRWVTVLDQWSQGERGWDAADALAQLLARHTGATAVTLAAGYDDDNFQLAAVEGEKVAPPLNWTDDGVEVPRGAALANWSAFLEERATPTQLASAFRKNAHSAEMLCGAVAPLLGIPLPAGALGLEAADEGMGGTPRLRAELRFARNAPMQVMDRPRLIEAAGEPVPVLLKKPREKLKLVFPVTNLGGAGNGLFTRLVGPGLASLSEFFLESRWGKAPSQAEPCRPDEGPNGEWIFRMQRTPLRATRDHGGLTLPGEKPGVEIQFTLTARVSSLAGGAIEAWVRPGGLGQEEVRVARWLLAGP